MAAKKSNIALFLCVPIKACSGRPFLRPNAPGKLAESWQKPRMRGICLLYAAFFLRYSRRMSCSGLIWRAGRILCNIL